jgi:hypothetical protein
VAAEGQVLWESQLQVQVLLLVVPDCSLTLTELPNFMQAAVALVHTLMPVPVVPVGLVLAEQDLQVIQIIPPLGQQILDQVVVVDEHRI